MTTTCLLAWAAILLLLPVIIIIWASESQPQRIRRWRQAGASQQQIADRLGITRYRVRQVLSLSNPRLSPA